jgi:hypothetical protein
MSPIRPLHAVRYVLGLTSLLLALPVSIASAQSVAEIQDRIEAELSRSEGPEDEAGREAVLLDFSSFDDLQAVVRAAVAEEVRGSGLHQRIRREVRAAVRESRRGPGRSSQLSTIPLTIWVLTLSVGLIPMLLAPQVVQQVRGVVATATLRSMIVGIASGVLVLPLFGLGLAVLVLSILGIVLLPVYVIAYPATLLTLSIVGNLAVALAVGERVTERQGEAGWFAVSPVRKLLVGVGVLAAPAMLAALAAFAGASVAAFLLAATSWLVLGVASHVGFGATLVALARRREQPE